MTSKTDGDGPPANGHPLYMQTLGEIIRGARTQKRISQERLGELTGVSRSAVNQWEKGSTQPDSADRLRRIAEALDIDPAILVRAGNRPAAAAGRADPLPLPRSQLGHQLMPLLLLKSVPSRGSRFGGFVLLAEKDGEIPRPESLRYNQKAFAFKVLDEANSPVYNPRDQLIVDPESPAIASDDCVFSDGIDPTDGSACLVGKLLRTTPTLWIVQQYSRKDELQLPKAEFPHAWPIGTRIIRK